ncbi:MAG: hypothetical protein P0Y64_16640 [Candidatus Sphingomonas colombiensis]|nr:hypothetical protein [Sphingomonas sp.]WEK42947.1 MAG: hypothetical protein P0Y64_16640 [Sphingomonas sp.]
MATLTRTIEIADLTPEELAAVFAGMVGEDQARFFSKVWEIALYWPGAGWCQQSYDIVAHLDRDGRSAIATLAAHLEGETQ